MKRILSVALAIVMAAIAAPVVAGTTGSAVCNNGVASRTLGDWQRQYFEWSLGASSEQQIGRVFFVPLPAETPVGDPPMYTGTQDVTARVGTAFVLPMSVWIGESYTAASNTPPDDTGC